MKIDLINEIEISNFEDLEHIKHIQNLNQEKLRRMFVQDDHFDNDFYLKNLCKHEDYGVYDRKECFKLLLKEFGDSYDDFEKKVLNGTVPINKRNVREVLEIKKIETRAISTFVANSIELSNYTRFYMCLFYPEIGIFFNKMNICFGSKQYFYPYVRGCIQPDEVVDFWKVMGKSKKDIENENDNQKLEFSDIKNIFDRRFVKIVRRCNEQNYPTPKKEVFKEVLQESLNNGFKCEYCNVQLRWKGRTNSKSGVNYEDLFTFDHLRPVSKNGVHTKDNIKVVCLACNVLKDNHDFDDFIHYSKKLDPKIRSKLYFDKEQNNQRVRRTFDNYIKEIKQKDKEIDELKRKLSNMTRENKLLIDKK